MIEESNSEISKKEIRNSTLLAQGSTLLLDAAQVEACKWHVKRFPEFYKLSPERQLKELVLKLTEEVGEVAAAVNKKESSIRVCEEATDSLLICLHILTVLSQSAENLFDSVMYKNNKRLFEQGVSK